MKVFHSKNLELTVNTKLCPQKLQIYPQKNVDKYFVKKEERIKKKGKKKRLFDKRK